MKNKLFNKDYLKYMYSKHLVSPRYIELSLLNIKRTILGEKMLLKELSQYDNDHFMGVNATKECISSSGINKDSIVLDLGSGFGGPARYIAFKTGCKVTGIEIQKDRYQSSINLTKLLALDHKVGFIYGDMVSVDLPKNHFTHIISFLAILHVIDKKMLLKRVVQLLKNGGKVYFEEYYLPRTLNTVEQKLLLNTVSSPNLLPANDFIKILEASGVMIEKQTDMTKEWRKLAEERSKNYVQNRKQLVNQFGELSARNAIEFTIGVNRLFDENIIGGFRLIGRKV